MSMQRLSVEQVEVLKLIQEVNEQNGVDLDSYEERFETLSYLVSNALDIEYEEYDKIITALEKYGYLEEFELTVDGEQYLEVGVQETMSVNIGNVNFNGKVEQVNIGDNNSIEKKGAFVSVEGNSITPSSSGIGTKLVEGAVEVVKDKFLGNKEH